MISRWDKLETYRVIKQLKADHMIDVRTYNMMLMGLGISEGGAGVTLFEGDDVIDLVNV